MTDPVKDLVAYLSGEPGPAGDRCRRALADPASDLSHFLTAARERTRSAVAEPAFRGLGLSPAACLPADPDLPTGDAEDRRDRRRLPWLVAVLALLVAGLTAWAPWRAGIAPAANDQPPAPGPVAAGDDRLDRPGQFPRGEGRVGPADAPGAIKSGPVVPKPEPPAVAAGPTTPPSPRAVPDKDPVFPMPPVGVPAPAKPLVLPADEWTKALEVLVKQLRERAQGLERERDALNRENAGLRDQVNRLSQEVARAANANAACITQAAALQKAIEALQARIDSLQPLADEVPKLRAYVKQLEAALKAQPPINPNPVKPKLGPGQGPELKQPFDPKKKQ